ncbi:hypothetical protein KW800_02110 [Candidatus Parcubacteria bacterium]|nr:hypothetical protein [Candidatus Parcubacteria bacterium]
MSSVVAPEPKEVKSENYQPITDPENVKLFIADYFADVPALQKVAACESHFRQYTAKGNVQRGEKNRYDVGVMQINELYHADEAKALNMNIYSIDGNVAYARMLYEREGLKPWSSSKGCWSRSTDIVMATK